jgi:hypothetical protein
MAMALLDHVEYVFARKSTAVILHFIHVCPLRMFHQIKSTGCTRDCIVWTTSKALQ